MKKKRNTYGLPLRHIKLLDSFGVRLDKVSVRVALNSGVIPKPIGGAGFKKHNSDESLPCFVTVGTMKYKALVEYAFGPKAMRGESA